ncbi:anthrax toxin receptor-like isoform X3 [Manis javanica]|uniref:anthrax toxin receptor-like isoform X3 n=1 Tax=Manis javanica TaxID=9974 RepID=UPI003C6D4E00
MALIREEAARECKLMLGPMFVILLLLLLPSPLLTTGSTLHRCLTQDQGHHPSSRLQESPADGESCWSTDDLYFVLDSSRSVNDNWEFTQSFVQDLVNRFKNPKQRMSFITYSTHGRINMKLTSNRKKINNALVELLNVRPSGGINMQHGLEKANEQIERTRAAGAKVPSLIIVLTGEQLLPESFAETQVEAAKSKQLGATLYFVGVQNYQLSQLLEIAGEEDHLFQVDSGYPGLEDIIDPLIARSCVQITSVDFSAICNRDTNEVKVIGKGFKNIQKDEVVCQFRLGKETARIEAVSVRDTSITCPGPKLNNQGKAVFIDISLNNGLSFIKTDFDVSRRSCVTSTERTPPALLDAVSPAAQRHTLPHAVPGVIRHIYPDEKSSSPVLSIKTLYWAVPLMVLPFLVLLWCCIRRRCTACIPGSLGKKCLTVIMSCCKKGETTAQTGDSAVPLLTPVVDHPAAHSINPAAIASSSAPAHGARVPNLPR